MSLNGVESVNGYLEAIAVDGTAVSKAIVQDGWNNISQSTVPDLLSTSTIITDGDNLDIVLNDGSINTVVASGVVPPVPVQNINNTLDTDMVGYANMDAARGTLLYSNQSLLLQQTSGTGDMYVAVSLTGYAGEEMRVRMTTPDAMTGGDPALYLTVGGTIVGSLYSLTQGQSIDEVIIITDDFDGIVFRMGALSTVDYHIDNIYFTIDKTQYEMDTSATTLGEIPDKVYLTDDVKELPFIGAKNVTADFEFKNIAIVAQNSLPSFTAQDTPFVLTGIQQGDPGDWVGFNGSDADRAIIYSDLGRLYIDYGEPVTIIDYTIRSGGFGQPKQTPTGMKLYGSTDNATWVLLTSDSFSNFTNKSTIVEATFPVDNPQSFRYLQIDPTNSQGNIYVGWADMTFGITPTPGSIVDTLITNDQIIDGDKLAIIKNDNSVHEMIAANVDNSAIIGTIGANVSIKDKIAFKNTALSATAWVGSNAYSNLTINSSGRYYFEVEIAGTTQVTMIGLSKNNTEQTNYFSAVATGYAIYSGNGSKYTNAVSEAVTSIFTSGDIVGIEYDYDTGEMSFWLNGISFGILYTLGAGITVYPAVSVHSTGTTWQNLRFKKEDMSFFPGGVYKVLQKDTYTMDTSSVTAGEIPNKVFRINESIEMNNNPISEDSNLYTAGATLLATRSFGEAVGSGVEIETKVKMSAIGNKMTGMTFDLWKEIPPFGPDLTIDGDFSNPASWTTTNASITIAGGQLLFSNVPASQQVYQSILTAGKTYRIIVDIASMSGGILAMGAGASISTPIIKYFDTIGLQEYTFTAIQDGPFGFISAQASCTAAINSVIVQEAL